MGLPDLTEDYAESTQIGGCLHKKWSNLVRSMDLKGEVSLYGCPPVWLD